MAIRLLEGLVDARLHLPTRYGIPKTSQLDRRRYKEAARMAEGERSKGITIYRPTAYELTGNEPGAESKITSRYASVQVGKNQEAWFEIIGTPNIQNINHAAFLTQHPLHLILGDTQSTDSTKLRAYSADPREDVALVRLVSLHETPLFNGRERASDPEQLKQAAERLARKLIEKSLQGGREAATSIEDLKVAEIAKAIAWDRNFYPTLQAPNGVIFGEPLTIHATIGNGHPRQLLIYPAQTADDERTYIITNKPLTAQESKVVGRMDFTCGCQLHGDRVGGNHGCGHELLGALRGLTPPEDATPREQSHAPHILVAWGGIGTNGNGEALQGIKESNMELAGTDRSQFKGRALRRLKRLEDTVARQENRKFDHHADTLWAAVSMTGANELVLQNGNRRKTDAMMQIAQAMALQNQGMKIYVESHAEAVVPASVRAAEQRERARVSGGLRRGRN